MAFRGKLTWDSKKNKFVEIKQKKKKEVHHVQQDTIDPIQSPISYQKKFFESKSAYRRHLKEHGFRDTGGEHLKDEPRPQTEEDIDREYAEGMEQDYYDIKYDRIQFTEAQKELHKQEDRKCQLNRKLKPR